MFLMYVFNEFNFRLMRIFFSFSVNYIRIW